MNLNTVLPEPDKRFCRSDGVEVSGTCHHVADGDENAPDAGPEGEEVHLDNHVYFVLSLRKACLRVSPRNIKSEPTAIFVF